MKKFLIVLLFLGCCPFLLMSREVKSLDEGWTFFKGFVKTGPVAGSSFGREPEGETVTLPHCYNASDFQTEGSYYRGYATYNRKLEIPENYAGKRIFLRFEGAGSVADVLVNSVFVGEHRGAYNAFTFEITDFVAPGENTLTVVCNNAPTFDVAPFGGDFNIYGGLYRNVWLEVLEPTCISPLYLGSEGVLISQDTNKERAELSAEIHLSTLTDYSGCKVLFSVLDARGNSVAETYFDNIFDDVVLCKVGIDHPHLWDGQADPYLYGVVISLLKDRKEIDRVEDHIGLRYYHVDREKGFFLNGKHLKLHGVSRHQDWDGLASALTEENHLTDFALFDEIGANSLRLAHYPQAKFMFQEADRRLCHSRVAGR